MHGATMKTELLVDAL